MGWGLCGQLVEEVGVKKDMGVGGGIKPELKSVVRLGLVKG